MHPSPARRDSRLRRERRLSELSARDPETALLNEYGFDERLREAVRRAIADATDVSLVVAELGSTDGTWTGSLCSPEALVVIERIQSTLRAGDELARTSDDELAWILPDTDADGALIVDAFVPAAMVATLRGDGFEVDVVEDVTASVRERQAEVGRADLFERGRPSRRGLVSERGRPEAS